MTEMHLPVLSVAFVVLSAFTYYCTLSFQLLPMQQYLRYYSIGCRINLFRHRQHQLYHYRLFSEKALEVSGHCESDDWMEHWSAIERMRGYEVAAVDTMGADALSRSGNAKDSNYRFQTLIACMLSPQTKDQQTSAAFDNLVALVAPDPLLPSTLSNRSVESIEQAIRMVSFRTVKSKNILEASRRCLQEFNNDIPTNIDDLLSFRGVGPKIAYLTFTIALGNTLGICVDTHVHRISNRLAWVDTWHMSNGPEQTRKQLESFLPKERWEHVNGLIVGFGQTICSAKAPKCSECLLVQACRYHNDKDHMRPAKKSSTSPV